MQLRGTIVEGWDRHDPFHLYGVKPGVVTGGGQLEAEAVGVDRSSPGGLSWQDRYGAIPWHPDSPLFWVGVIGAVTFGLMALSTTVRVGPIRAGIAAGKT